MSGESKSSGVYGDLVGKKVLLTGGAGYIGSHVSVELQTAGAEVVVMDNLSNASLEALNRVEQITGKKSVFHEVDLCDMKALQGCFAEHKDAPFDACIHFAGLKAVGESVMKPLMYYENNLQSTTNLLRCLEEMKCTRFVFSSSATVYGDPEKLPITEASKTGATNPYGRTKLFIEEILRDVCTSDLRGDKKWRVAVLRYFNPIGAHASGLIGEDPLGIPNNLCPYLAQVASGRREQLTIFGNQYDTPDGTGVRDYIHVVDLAHGHLAALNTGIFGGLVSEENNFEVYNLGTGNGYSVLEMLKALEVASGKTIKYVIGPNREGDIATCYADCSKAKQELNWTAEKTLADCMEDLWRFQSGNPLGYNPAKESSTNVN